MISIDYLHAALAIFALAAVAFAVWMRQARAPDVTRLETELQREREERASDLAEAARDLESARADREKETSALRAEREALRTRAETAERKLEVGEATLRERESAFARELARMEKLQTEAEQRFKAMAQTALVESQQKFVQLADETFKKHQEGAKGELGTLMKPIQETIGQFREKVDAIEKVRSEDRARLDEQIRQMGETMQSTQQITGRLASALASPKHGGRWGEETLRNVLEMSGLSPYADFTEQVVDKTEDGLRRPDVIVRMPGKRELVIDSKVSLDDYLAASDEPDTARKQALLASHAQKVRQHIQGLAKKDYWKGFSDRVDFVAMFIPGENFYAAVLEHDRGIFDYAAKNNIIIVTPSTLIALAKAVAYGWRQEEANRNAEQAVELGRELYARLVTMCDHMSKVGGDLDRTVGSFNKLVGSYERKVMPQVRRFEELQIPTESRVADAPAALGVQARAPQLAERETAPSREEGDAPGLFDADAGGSGRKRKASTS